MEDYKSGKISINQISLAISASIQHINKHFNRLILNQDTQMQISIMQI